MVAHSMIYSTIAHSNIFNSFAAHYYASTLSSLNLIINYLRKIIGYVQPRGNWKQWKLKPEMENGNGNRKHSKLECLGKNFD